MAVTLSHLQARAHGDPYASNTFYKTVYWWPEIRTSPYNPSPGFRILSLRRGLRTNSSRVTVEWLAWIPGMHPRDHKWEMGQVRA